MLVERAPENTKIVAIKLITGEEVIARQLNTTGDTVMISRPLSMIMAENPDNPAQTRVMFTPWMVAAGKETVSVKNQHILAICPAREDAADQYEQAIAA